MEVAEWGGAPAYTTGSAAVRELGNPGEVIRSHSHFANREPLKRNPPGTEYSKHIGEGSFSNAYWYPRGKGDMAVEVVTETEVGEVDGSKDVLILARAALLASGDRQAAARLPALRRKRLDVDDRGRLEFIYATPRYEREGASELEENRRIFGRNGEEFGQHLVGWEAALAAVADAARARSKECGRGGYGWRWDMHQDNWADQPADPVAYEKMLKEHAKLMKKFQPRLGFQLYEHQETPREREKRLIWEEVRGQMAHEREEARQLIFLDPIVAKVPADALAALWVADGFKLPKGLQ